MADSSGVHPQTSRIWTFFAGLPCCSFIWLNRSTSMRSADVPFGDQLKLYIQQANVLLDNWISKYSFF